MNSTFRFRDCRNIGVAFQVWPIQWHMGWKTWEDSFARVDTFSLGPFAIEVAFNVGWWPTAGSNALARIADEEHS